MATVKLHQPANMLLARNWPGYITAATPTRITVSSHSGEQSHYDGSFRYINGLLAGGVVTGFSQPTGYSPHYEVSGMQLDAVAVQSLALSGNATALIQLAATGSDVFHGSHGSDVLPGYGGSDVLRGNGGADTLHGGEGDDVLVGGAGQDVLIGDAGIDTAVYEGTRSSYSIASTAAGLTVTDSLAARDGTDTLALVELLQFSDMSVTFDVEGHAGQAYRLYEAALNRTPDVPGLGYHIRRMDAGASLLEVAQNFIDSPEFRGTYGVLDSGAFVTLLYQNVLGRTPDAEGWNHHMQRLGDGAPRAEILVGFSESPENKAALAGVMSAGMEYI